MYRTAPGRVQLWTCPHKVLALVSGLTRTRTWPVVRPTTPTIGGRSLASLPRPRRLLARRRGGSVGSRGGLPFFPRILKHFVTFGLPIRQGVFGLQLFSLRLQLVAQG